MTTRIDSWMKKVIQVALGGVHRSILLTSNCRASSFFQLMYLHQSTESSTLFARWTSDSYAACWKTKKKYESVWKIE